jgi:pimeloyl-ACP methyl ester carboxylesterase
MGLDELSVEVAGTPVRTYWAGTGPALVLLHGGGLDDARLTWAPVGDRLTAHVQVVAPDLPGYGGSPLGPTPATLEGYRTWLLEFLDACDLGQATLAGLSLGGGIALRTVLDEPTRVRALTLIAPYGVSSRLPGGRTGYFSVHTPGATAITDTMLRHSDRLLRASLQALLHRPDAVTQELITEVRALLTRPDAGAGHWLPRDAPDQVAEQLLGFLPPADAAQAP